MNNVRIEARGQEYVPTEGGDAKAMRYAYTGELETEVWYDQEDRWVKMRFVGKDGVYQSTMFAGSAKAPMRNQ